MPVLMVCGTASSLLDSGVPFRMTWGYAIVEANPKVSGRTIEVCGGHKTSQGHWGGAPRLGYALWIRWRRLTPLDTVDPSRYDTLDIRCVAPTWSFW